MKKSIFVPLIFFSRRCVIFRCLLCLFVLLLLPQLSDAQVGHVKDADAVLYASFDPVIGSWDIFACDPVSGKTVNLTKGEVGREGGWSQPWEPVGNQHKVVFRQWRDVGGNTESRIFVLEARGNTTVIHQVPDIFAFAVYFSWSNDNKSFAFVNEYDSGAPQTEVIIVENEMVKARIPTPFSKCRSEWSKDGKWIAVISTVDEGLLLISTEDYSQTPISLAGSVSSTLAWGSDSRRLALVLDRILSIIDLEGSVLQTFGEASFVGDWSADGKYISYGTRSPFPTGRQLHILFLGGVEEVDSGYVDENCGIWSPDSTILAFWARDQVGYSLLMVVGPDGKNARFIGDAWSPNYMPPSWFKLPRGMLEAAGQ